MKAIPYRLLKLSLFLFALLICGCGSLMATFDQTSYSQVISLKVDALALLDKSTDDYSLHVADIAALQLELSKAVEYDKHRPHNDITNDMWNLMNDPNGHLLAGFLVKWKKDGKESQTFVADQKTTIGNSFDQIAELEIKKIKQ